MDELQRALVNGDLSPFNVETVRTMVNMFDSGKYCTVTWLKGKSLFSDAQLNRQHGND